MVLIATAAVLLACIQQSLNYTYIIEKLIQKTKKKFKSFQMPRSNLRWELIFWKIFGDIIYVWLMCIPRANDNFIVTVTLFKMLRNTTEKKKH